MKKRTPPVSPPAGSPTPRSAALCLTHRRQRLLAAPLALAAASAAVGVLGVPSTRAAVIGPGDFSGNETLIDFNTGRTYGYLTSHTYQDATISTTMPGVLFNTDNEYYTTLFDNIPSASFGRSGALHVRNTNDYPTSNEGMRVSFSTPVRRAGLVLTTAIDKSWSVSAFDDQGAELESNTFTQPAAGDAVFAGFQTQRPIAYMDITDNQPIEDADSYPTLFDDLRYEDVNVGANFGYLLDLYDQIASGELSDRGQIVANLLGWVGREVLPNYDHLDNFETDLLDWWQTTGAAHFEHSDEITRKLNHWIDSNKDEQLWWLAHLHNFSLNASTVPEPATLALLATGAPIVLLRRRRRETTA